MSYVYLVTVTWGAHDPCAVRSIWATREEAERESARLDATGDGFHDVVEVPLGEHRDEGWN